MKVQFLLSVLFLIAIVSFYPPTAADLFPALCCISSIPPAPLRGASIFVFLGEVALPLVLIFILSFPLLVAEQRQERIKIIIKTRVLPPLAPPLRGGAKGAFLFFSCLLRGTSKGN
jgi:hypothetical protein